MRIPGDELRGGDVIQLHDWTLHVVGVENGAVRTAEFAFLLHFRCDDLLDVRRTRQPAQGAA